MSDNRTREPVSNPFTRTHLCIPLKSGTKILTCFLKITHLIIYCPEVLIIKCVVSEYMKEKIYCLTLKIQTLIDFVKKKLQVH